MDRNTANSFVERIRQHRKAEEAIWDEMRAHPDYEQHEDKGVAEIIDALEAADDAVSCANDALDAFDFVPDPQNEGEFVHKDELDQRRRSVN
jgi:hypothetical protein